MQVCCASAVIFIIAFVILAISKAAYDKDIRNTEMIRSYKSRLCELEKNIKNKKDIVVDSISNFFSEKQAGDYSDYHSVYRKLEGIISAMNQQMTEMQVTNRELVKVACAEDQSRLLNRMQFSVISEAEDITEGLRKFGEKVYVLPISKMMDEKSYGKINKAYWDDVCSMQKYEVMAYISDSAELLKGTEFDRIYAIDIEKVLKCVWYFAIENIFSASDFQKARGVFMSLYRHGYVDLTIANLYSKQKLGGEAVIRDYVRNLLKYKDDSATLSLLASSLMWMNAYQSESMILQHMLTAGNEMNVKLQERLYSLSNGAGKAPNEFNVKSCNDVCYFDVSALAWKEDEYIGLFENLAFQDKILTYSLAVREENKELFLVREISMPDVNAVQNKFKAVFEDEYGMNVTTQVVNCVALSGSDEEKLEGVLVTANECRQLGILIYTARIGKKIIIKFYTLFMPNDSNLVAQKRQVLSIYKKLSPSVSMWESSLKDTMLMAVEQLLNSNVMAENNEKTIDEVTVFKHPIF